MRNIDIFPYKKVAQKNITAIEKFSHKINANARKSLVLSQVVNPRVSQIQNDNREYLQKKEENQRLKESIISIDQTYRNHFDKLKSQMREIGRPKGRRVTKGMGNNILYADNDRGVQSRQV